jgi:hypothetical protein
MTTYPGLSIHKDTEGRYFIAYGFSILEHGEPEPFRCSPFYTTAPGAAAAYEEKAREYRAAVPGQVLDILRRENVTEPSGEWSAFDVARELDPLARTPRDMFDTGAETWPRDEWVALALEVLNSLDVPKRYVGGTSRYLYGGR